MEENVEKVAELVELEAARDVERAVDVIRDARARRNANGAQIAKRARVAVQTVSNMNVGKGAVSLETLARVARALGLRLVLIPSTAGLLDEGAPLPELDTIQLERAAFLDREGRRAQSVAAGDVAARWDAERSAAERDARKLAAGDVWPWAEAGAPVPLEG